MSFFSTALVIIALMRSSYSLFSKYRDLTMVAALVLPKLISIESELRRLLALDVWSS